jgi:hypothetical protein
MADKISAAKKVVQKITHSQATYSARKANDWFVEKVKRYTSGKSAGRLMHRDAIPRIGHMYMYKYDPKHKLTLPYYDAMPLVIPIHYYKDGFLGMNLHYIPPELRRQLLNMLIAYFGKGTGDERYMKLTYEKLNSIYRVRAFQPCIKRYLWGHFRSRPEKIPPDEWANAVNLPTARWKKSTAKSVYKDSKAKIL